MTENELIGIFSKLKVWKRQGERAPHKPLVILHMLARVANGEPRLVSYEDVQSRLHALLRDFGPPRKTTPAYPFLYLQSDGFWDFVASPGVMIGRSPSDSRLIEANARGGFSEEVYVALRDNPQLIKRIASKILDQSFPSTIHEDILQAVGLDLDLVPGSGDGQADQARARRDSMFRDRLLQAYEYRCAVCGFSVWLGSTPVGLEAAHIKWHQAGGPDREENGLLLCTMHHKLFDRGAFSLDQSLRIQVSQAAHGGYGFEEWLMKYHGNPVRIPERPAYQPNHDYVSWHLREVFRGEFRYRAGA